MQMMLRVLQTVYILIQIVQLHYLFHSQTYFLDSCVTCHKSQWEDFKDNDWSESMFTGNVSSVLQPGCIRYSGDTVINYWYWKWNYFLLLMIESNEPCQKCFGIQINHIYRIGWQSTPIESHTPTNITLRSLPTNPTAVRFLWYLPPPYGVTPTRSSVYVGNLSPMSGELTLTPKADPYHDYTVVNPK